MSLLRHKDVNMLEGPLIPKIIALAVPLMISNLLQMLYTAADMIVVARSGVAATVGAIGSTAQIINLILVLFVGFSVGANVVVARYIGAREPDKVTLAVHTALFAAAVFGVAGGAVGYASARRVMALLGEEGQLLELATKYCRIRFVGMPFLALTNFLIAIFRAKGDGTTPLTVLALSGLANVLLNLFFVLVLHMDVDGVAWATVIASVLSVAQLLFHLMRTEGPCRFSFRLLKLDWKILAELLRIGVPAGIQSALYTVSNMLITSSLLSVNNRVCPGGSAVIDGNSAAQSIANLASTCTDALVTSLVSFASQHVGARKYRRLRTFIGDAYLCCFVFSITSSWLLWLLRDPLLSMYISDPIAYETAYTRMGFMLRLYFLGALMSCGGQVLRGMGWSMTSTMITLILTCLLRIVWIYTVFAQYGTLTSIYVSYPISWGIAAIAQFIGVMLCYRHLTRKNQPALAND